MIGISDSFSKYIREIEYYTSKYSAFRIYAEEAHITLSFDEIAQNCAVSPDHSFTQYKKELLEYGYKIKKVSMKAQAAFFIKKEE